MNADNILRVHQSLKVMREPNQKVWDDCLFSYLPEMQNTGTTKIQGEQGQPLDLIGMNSLTKLSAGIFSNTVSMGDEFFGFKTNDPGLNKNESVKRFFSKAAEIVLKQMQSSNYMLSTYEAITYYCALNTAVQYVEYNNEDGLVFNNFPITGCSIAQDHLGKVNTLYREFKMSAAQAVGRWGERCSKEVVAAYESEQTRYQEFEFVHAVMPREERDTKKIDNENMPFASYYVDIANKHICEESGYTSFPYAVPRFFKVGSEPYGRGPSFTCLPTFREICDLRSDISDGVKLLLQPPVFMPGTSGEDDIDLSPGAINFYNPADGKPIFYTPTIDIERSRDYLMTLKDDIKDAFFVDVFKMLDDLKNMTATEVNERMAEKIQQIVPVVSRLYEEFFSVMITRCFELLLDAEKITDVPEELVGTDYKVEYTTKLDNRLKSLEIGQVLKTFQEIMVVAEALLAEPDLRNFFDIDKVYDIIAQGNNVDVDLVREEVERSKLRQAEAEAKQKQQEADQLASSMKPIDAQQANAPGSILNKMEEANA